MKRKLKLDFFYYIYMVNIYSQLVKMESVEHVQQCTAMQSVFQVYS